jgi:N6-L-threonylcarbamoyladenine synthase
MLVLGIESSCDDTAAAVVADGSQVLSSIVSSQDDIHAEYGGVVPELASRRHIEAMIPVVDTALGRAGVTIDDIDAIAVTRGPGLVGSILIGLSFAKAVSYARGIPYTGVNHIAAHPLAVFLTDDAYSEDKPEFPFVALVVSGGHTTLMLIKGFTEYEVLGATLDDAAGEAFDKTAKLLGLGFPGGKAIDDQAAKGDARYVNFTRPYLAKGSLDFSFSGIKTAVLMEVKRIGGELSEEAVAGLAASFQEAVVDVLVKKSIWALKETGTRSLVAAGGVACNSRLRARLATAVQEDGSRLYIPPPRLCSDNAAMVALLGFHQLKDGSAAALEMDAVPNWKEL